MNSYATSATVEDEGQIRVAGIPFAPGTQVNVAISPKQEMISKQPAHDELEEVYKECRVADWDGYGAEPVDPETLRNAHRLIDALPSGYPLPSAGAEPDGHMTLEWYRATNWLLSVSINSDGTLHYAALLGDEDPRGTCRFNDDFPETILYWIRRVAPND